jgi:MFS family permease
VLSSAQNGLTSAIGQQHVMSGQISAAWTIFGSLPVIAALILGGFLSDLMERRDAAHATHLLFLLGAAIMALVALFHSVTGALIAAAPIGLMGGVATAAYLDLMIRSCPRGLQGTLLMMSVALYAIVTGLGNLLGTYLYEHFGGFAVCVIAITVVYALILPVLLLVPKRLIDTADGRAPEVAFTTD